MKNLNLTLLALCVIALGLNAQTSPTENPPAPVENKILYYTCSMHPEVHSEKPGECPKCGMNLVPVYDNANKETPPAEKNQPDHGCCK